MVVLRRRDRIGRAQVLLLHAFLYVGRVVVVLGRRVEPDMEPRDARACARGGVNWVDGLGGLGGLGVSASGTAVWAV